MGLKPHLTVGEPGSPRGWRMVNPRHRRARNALLSRPRADREEFQRQNRSSQEGLATLGEQSHQKGFKEVDPGSEGLWLPQGHTDTDSRARTQGRADVPGRALVRRPVVPTHFPAL